MISKPDFDWFWAKISDAKRGGATHTRVAPFKMAWLILDIESCGGTDQIDMLSDVHVEESRAEWTIQLRRRVWRDSKVKDLKKKLFSFISRIFIKKRQK
jgi:hypothetical protein